MTQKQRVLTILRDGKPHTHHEFYGFCVLHSRISDLRRDGHRISCWRDGDDYLYQLLPTAHRAEGGTDGESAALSLLDGSLAAAAPCPSGHLPEAGPVVERPSTPGADPQIPPAQLSLTEAA